jgi:DNA-binding HxlR family transcriptional regulator
MGQENAMVDSRTCAQHKEDPEVAGAVSAMLARIGDKWSLLIVATLGEGPMRFNELRRNVEDISQKMLSSTLKVLERDGLVIRTVIASVPPQVQYALTDLGCELLLPVSALAQWTTVNASRIVAARAEYDVRVETLATNPPVSVSLEAQGVSN